MIKRKDFRNLIYHRVVCGRFTKLLFPPSKTFNISSTTKIAHGGLYVTNPNCVIINAECIGEGCIIGNCTTIGTNGNPKDENHRPKIGNNVFIGSMCGIFGPIKIGDNVIIENGSIITKDIPDNSIAFGNPVNITSRFKN